MSGEAFGKEAAAIAHELRALVYEALTKLSEYQPAQIGGAVGADSGPEVGEVVH